MKTKFLNSVAAAMFLASVTATVQAEVLTAPAGAVITATAVKGSGEVVVTTNFGSLLRYCMSKQCAELYGGKFTASLKAASATFKEVCRADSNGKPRPYEQDARFQIVLNGKFLLVEPKAVPNATLQGIVIGYNQKGHALHVDPAVVKIACEGFDQQD